MLAATGVLLGGLLAAEAALAQKAGGVLSIYHRDGPASMSILEEATAAKMAAMHPGRPNLPCQFILDNKFYRE